MVRWWLIASSLLAACGDASVSPAAPFDAPAPADPGPAPEDVAEELPPPGPDAPDDVLVMPTDTREGPPPGLLSVGPEIPCLRGGTPGVFTESREALGITFTQSAKDTGGNGPPQGWAIGGGTAVADFDGDGWLDLAFANVVGPDELYLTSGQGPLLWQRHELVRPQSSIHVGAYATDADGDGDVDILYSPAGSGGGLALNDGLGSFTMVPNVVPQYGQVIDFSLAWGDVNADGALDILVAGGPDSSIIGNNGPGAPERLYLGAKGKVSYTQSPMPTYPVEGQGFIAAFVDIDNDHDQDVYVVNDFGLTVLQNQLLVNDGTGHFEDRSDDAYSKVWGMGFGTGDFDNDGWMDLWAGTMLPLDDILLQNNHDGTFDDVTWYMKAGSMAYGEGVSWGATFIDVENDGDEDLFVTHGFHPLIGAAGGPGTAQTPNPAEQPDVLLINNGCDVRQTVGGPDRCEPSTAWNTSAKAACAGRVPIGFRVGTPCGEKAYRDASFTCCKPFVNGSKSSGLAGPAAGRCPVEADLDGDGFPDLIVGNLNAPPDVYLNGCSDTVSWLGVRLRPSRANSGAIGTRINVVAGGRMHTREIGSGSDGLFGSPPPEVTVGLGEATTVERLEVIWLGGETQVFEGLAVRRWVTVWQAP